MVRIPADFAQLLKELKRAVADGRALMKYAETLEESKL